MSDVSVLPGTPAVRSLFEDLLGREVTVSPGDPLSADQIATATVAIFTDSAQKVYAVLGMELSLAANAGAAEVLGVDASEPALELGRRNAAATGWDRRLLHPREHDRPGCRYGGQES